MCRLLAHREIRRVRADQSTDRGSMERRAHRAHPLHAGEIAGSFRICAEISVFAIDGGTVQVGLRLTLVISAVSVGEGFSVLPTITR